MRVRRTPEQADMLRARMLHEGYPLADLSRKDNDYVWVSLTQRRRWRQLQQVTGLSDGQLDAQVKAISAQHFALTGRK